MKVFALLWGFVAIFVTLPIWFYLLYQILERVNAGELMWFLYWVYVPFTILIHAVGQLVKGESK